MLVKTLAAGLLFLCHATIQAEELKAGSYTLEMTIPKMAAAERSTEMAGKVQKDGKAFKFHAKGTHGHAIVLHGMETKSGIVMWTSAEESGFVRTIHYTGKFAADGELAAEGKLSLIQNHKRVTGGTWKLRPADEPEK